MRTCSSSSGWAIDVATDRTMLLGVGLVGAVALYALSRTAAGAALAADAVGAAVSALLPRGIRNNNPGNIDWIEDPAKRWNGMIGRDGRFGVFDHMSRGVRALGHELDLDGRRGIRTVEGLISSWAPPKENDTAAYIAAVASELKVKADQVIDVRSYLPRLAASIIKHENGSNPLSLDDITRWVYLP